MNDRYFGCTDCHEYTDAGYRWAYWLLEEPGVVAIDSHVEVSNVINAADYWSPPSERDSDWLTDSILPTVRKFLAAHSDQKVIYFDFDRIACDDTFDAKWQEVTA